MIIAVTGSTGLVGKALVAALEADGHLVRPLVRRAPRAEKNEIGWDPASGKIDAAELAAAAQRFEKSDYGRYLAGLVDESSS